jgi:hypothetical protein
VSPAAPHVEFLWWRGCPSADDALERLRAELHAAGLDPQAVEVREIDTAAAAAAEEFVGSPTIRLDGRDVQPPGDEPVGLTCRVYATHDGRVTALPEAAILREAIKQAIEGEER